MNINETQKVEKKRVKFQPAVRVVLIPSRTEYIASNLLSTLWWNDIDYSAFKNSAVMELKAVMRSNSISNSKEAIRILYQPSIDEDFDMFITEEIDTHLVPFSTSPPPMIEDIDDIQIPKLEIISEKENIQNENELFEKKSDFDLIDHYNFTKTKNHIIGQVHPNAEVVKLHPLAYLCN